MTSRPSLDDIDAAIIEALQHNARITNKALATEVGLSPSACLQRVRRLEDVGVFTGYHARVDPPAVGAGLEALVQVRLQRHTRTTIERFREHCLALSEVTSFAHLSGRSDFVLQVAVRDTQHLRDFLMDAFTSRGEVAHLETAVVLDRIEHAPHPVYVE